MYYEHIYLLLLPQLYTSSVNFKTNCGERPAGPFPWRDWRDIVLPRAPGCRADIWLELVKKNTQGTLTMPQVRDIHSPNSHDSKNVACSALTIK